jgi:hypothetical protein
MKSPRLKTLQPKVKTLDTRTVKPLEKTADKHYGTAEHQAWALAVKKRAGWQCEYVEHGERCKRSLANGDQMYADHIKDVKDYPELKLDLNNGRAACNSHNTRAGIHARAARMAQKFRTNDE